MEESERMMEERGGASESKKRGEQEEWKGNKRKRCESWNGLTKNTYAHTIGVNCWKFHIKLCGRIKSASDYYCVHTDIYAGR